jgi:hypothetical protein
MHCFNDVDKEIKTKKKKKKTDTKGCPRDYVATR